MSQHAELIARLLKLPVTGGDWHAVDDAIAALQAEPVPMTDQEFTAWIESSMTDKLRAEFEAWIAKEYFVEKPEWELERNCYKEFITHMAWKGWLEGREAMRAECVKVCDKHANFYLDMKDTRGLDAADRIADEIKESS